MMPPSGVVLLVAVAVLFVTGLYLIMQRSLLRIVVGFVLLGHAANLALLTAGGMAGAPPLLPALGRMADPLPQAMALTAIVITFGTTALVLALAYSSWRSEGSDEVPDDLEDRRIAREQADQEEEP